MLHAIRLTALLSWLISTTQVYPIAAAGEKKGLRGQVEDRPSSAAEDTRELQSIGSLYGEVPEAFAVQEVCFSVGDGAFYADLQFPRKFWTLKCPYLSLTRDEQLIHEKVSDTWRLFQTRGVKCFDFSVCGPNGLQYPDAGDEIDLKVDVGGSSNSLDMKFRYDRNARTRRTFQLSGTSTNWYITEITMDQTAGSNTLKGRQVCIGNRGGIQAHSKAYGNGDQPSHTSQNVNQDVCYDIGACTNYRSGSGCRIKVWSQNLFDSDTPCDIVVKYDPNDGGLFYTINGVLYSWSLNYGNHFWRPEWGQHNPNPAKYLP